KPTVARSCIGIFARNHGLTVAADVADWGRGNYGQAGMRQRRRRTLRADRRRAWLAGGAAALAAVCAGAAVAQTPPKPTDAEACLAANASLSLGAALPRV